MFFVVINSYVVVVSINDVVINQNKVVVNIWTRQMRSWLLWFVEMLQLLMCMFQWLICMIQWLIGLTICSRSIWIFWQHLKITHSALVPDLSFWKFEYIHYRFRYLEYFIFYFHFLKVDHWLIHCFCWSIIYGIKMLLFHNINTISFDIKWLL